MDSNIKILIVDDFPPMRRAVKGYLSELGFSSISEADSAEAALNKLKREPFQLIISDWKMPDMMGSEFLRAVRSDKSLQSIPFLVVTSAELKDDAMAGITGTSAQFIVKPFDASSLRAKLEQALGITLR